MIKLAYFIDINLIKTGIFCIVQKWCFSWTLKNKQTATKTKMPWRNTDIACKK